MKYSFLSPLSTESPEDPIIVDSHGQEVVAVRIDDVWGPNNDVIPGHQNAKFILAVLNGENIDFPEGATPGPWGTEQDLCAKDNGSDDSWFLIAGSPEGVELLALFNTPMRKTIQDGVEQVPT